MHRDFDLPDTPKNRRLLFIDLIFTRTLYLLTAAILIINTIVLVSRADKNKAILTRLESCTTPGQTCYEQGQKRSKSTISALIDSLIKDQEFVTYCAHIDLSTLTGLERCVTRLENHR